MNPIITVLLLKWSLHCY